MTKNSLVSIITPCYNVEKWVERYFKSILNQKYKRIQLVLINDGSTDESEKIILKYKPIFEKQGMIFTYRYQDNQGLGSAINNGLKLVKGEFFCWCDSDNFYSTDYVSEKVHFFNTHPNYSIVRCDGNIVNSDNIDKIISKMSKGNRDLYNDNLFENCLFVHNFHFGCAMLKTSDFDKVNPNRNIYPSREGQNWQLLLPMFYYYKSGYIDKAMFTFVYRSDSVSNITQMQSLDKKINQKKEYVLIIKNTLEQIGLDVYKKYFPLIEQKYASLILRDCIYHSNREIPQNIYNQMKQKNLLTTKIKILYKRSQSKVFNFLYKGFIILPCKIFNKIKTIFGG